MNRDLVNWLFFDMNAYFASVEQHDHPELRGRPVVVAPVLVDSTCCIAASYEAKRYGIATGTAIAEARRLCPALHVVEARPERYVEVHQQILKAVEAVLPVSQVHSIDEMSCRLTGPHRFVEKALALGRSLKESLRKRVGASLLCSVGIAPNRFLAKVAAEMQKPDGLTVLLPDEVPERLFALSLEDLPGIGRRMSERLRRAGIQTVEQLCQHSPESLRELWGSIVGERWWSLLRGHDLPEPPTKRRSIGHSHVLPPEFAHPEGARAVWVKLIHKAAVRLRGLKYWAARITFLLDYRSRAAGWKRSIRLTPAQDTQTFLGILSRMWDEIPFPARPLRVGIVLSDLISAASLPPLLFEEDRRRLRAAQTVDAINARFGTQSIYWAAMHSARQAAPMRIAFTHIPEEKEAM